MTRLRELFAQNLFGALSDTPTGARPSRAPAGRVLAGEAAIVFGVPMGLVFVLVLHDRRSALAATR